MTKPITSPTAGPSHLVTRGPIRGEPYRVAQLACRNAGGGQETHRAGRRVRHRALDDDERVGAQSAVGRRRHGRDHSGERRLSRAAVVPPRRMVAPLHHRLSHFSSLRAGSGDRLRAPSHTELRAALARGRDPGPLRGGLCVRRSRGVVPGSQRRHEQGRVDDRRRARASRQQRVRRGPRRALHHRSPAARARRAVSAHRCGRGRAGDHTGVAAMGRADGSARLAS